MRTAKLDFFHRSQGKIPVHGIATIARNEATGEPRVLFVELDNVKKVPPDKRAIISEQLVTERRADCERALREAEQS